MDQLLQMTAGWHFLNEPLWAWAIFTGAMMAIVVAWRGVIDLMK